MNVLIIMPMFYPIPAIKGGAIENLVDEYLKYNSKNQENNITVYTIYDEEITNECIEKYNNTVFRRINKNKYMYKIEKMIKGGINRLLRKLNNEINDVYISRIIKDIKKKNELDKYDLVIVENIGKYVIPMKRLFGNKVVLHLHNDYLNIETLMNKKIYSSCKEIWAISNFIKNRVNEIDKSNKKAITIYNGIDTVKFSKVFSDKEKNKIRKKYNINNDDIVILYVGRIMKEKGVKELISAYIKMREEKQPLKNTKLLIVGSTKNNTVKEEKYYQTLKEMSKKFESDIIFTGKISYDELPIMYAVSNMQVVPSIWNEAFGLIIVEGMASGLPVIGTNTGAIPELVDNIGIIVQKEKMIDELASNMKYLIENENKRIELANKSIKKSKEFDKANYCKNIQESIKRIIRGG